jgi:hypothetical protein
MVKSGKVKSIQAQVASVIDQLRLDINTLEAETQQNQCIYDDLAQEIKTKLSQRIKKVKDGDWI